MVPFSNEDGPSHHRQLCFPLYEERPKTAFAHFRSMQDSN